MNKNVINVSLLLSASVLPSDMLSLTGLYDNYSDATIQYPKTMSQIDDITQISLIEEKKSIWFGLSASEMSRDMKIEDALSDIVILESVVHKIKGSKPLEPEFAKIIEDNFWDLI